MTKKLAMVMILNYEFVFQLNYLLVVCKTFTMTPMNLSIRSQIGLLKVWGNIHHKLLLFWHPI